MNVDIDWTFTIKDLLMLGGFLFGGISVAFTLRSDVRELKKEIVSIKDDVAECLGIVTTQAITTTRLDNQAERMTRLERLQDDMRRGDGFILPLKPHG